MKQPLWQILCGCMVLLLGRTTVNAQEEGMGDQGVRTLWYLGLLGLLGGGWVLMTVTIRLRARDRAQRRLLREAQERCATILMRNYAGPAQGPASHHVVDYALEGKATVGNPSLLPTENPTTLKSQLELIPWLRDTCTLPDRESVLHQRIVPHLLVPAMIAMVAGRKCATGPAGGVWLRLHAMGTAIVISVHSPATVERRSTLLEHGDGELETAIRRLLRAHNHVHNTTCSMTVNTCDVRGLYTVRAILRPPAGRMES